MIITPHLIAGAAIGSKIESYWLVAILSLIFHYLLDIIPHREYKVEILGKKFYGRQMIGDLFKLTIDFIVGVFLILLFLNEDNFFNLNYMITGMFFSILPDIFSFFKINFNYKFFYYHSQFHKLIHFFKGKNIPRWIEVGSQIAVSVIGLWVMR